jgi:hypothetical protein
MSSLSLCAARVASPTALRWSRRWSREPEVSRPGSNSSIIRSEARLKTIHPIKSTNKARITNKASTNNIHNSSFIPLLLSIQRTLVLDGISLEKQKYRYTRREK